ncbi:putative bifunctional diguanylate cyclase/phosphodiesterase [Thiomicrorhabdus aquaedulcis]|uniref:putative bifunctional diguanylate cyclase/phosphodiesterase n=1 Tax=Thiomicrorhabdus aquaedulcis TaxID=2211106 RepID=UPI000FD9B267|nr:GGDEF domain-containing phosphodiesterase [Thiomicrorhabdus aquaedulcis]
MALQRIALKQTQQQDQQNLAIASIAFESHEAIIITDTHGQIIRSNQAFSDLTGYRRDEIIGKTPRAFKSGLHNVEFYASLWHSVMAKGKWQGEIWNRKKDGTLYPSWLSISAVHNAQGVITHYISHASDLTRDKESERKIHYLYNHDNLTNLPNRVLLLDRLEQQLLSQDSHYNALFLINIYRFKMFNESLGHAAGDAILVAVAERLKNCKIDDVLNTNVARIGSDEFTLLAKTDAADSISTTHLAGRIARRIQEKLSEPYIINGQSVIIDTTLGITVFNAGLQKAEEIIQEAQTALHRAKLNAKHSRLSTLQFYEPAMQLQAQKRLQLETDLRRALTQNEFVLYFQPQLDLKTNTILGAESLIRWQKSPGQLVPPNEFIPVLEETGLMVPVGYWILEEALKQAAKIHLTHPNFTVAVNLSAMQFNDEHLVENIQTRLSALNYPASRIELEVTESILMINATSTLDKLNALAELGIHIAIDDFGTGYSSLAYLKRFPVTKLKIDKSFIDDLNSHLLADTAIVQATIDMARALNIKTIAEGVETAEQKARLTSMQCDQIQGYYLAKPMPIESFLHFINAGNTA